VRFPSAQCKNRLRTTTISEITNSVAKFLQDNIMSVWQLELLLYLRGSNVALTPTQIADALYMSPEAMASGLIHFQNRGLVKPSGSLLGAYRYAPVRPELEMVIDKTAQEYADKRVAIVNLIFSKTAETI
jgi:hypothetical protein